MDVNAVLQGVSAVGFPIVIALLAAWYIKYLGDKNSEMIKQMNDQILTMSDKQNTQLDKMADAITEVQKSLAALTYTIQRAEDDKR